MSIIQLYAKCYKMISGGLIIIKLIENPLFIIIDYYQTYGESFIYYRHTMVTGLQEIDKLKTQMGDIQVPLEVFE